MAQRLDSVLGLDKGSNLNGLVLLTVGAARAVSYGNLVNRKASQAIERIVNGLYGSRLLRREDFHGIYGFLGLIKV